MTPVAWVTNAECCVNASADRVTTTVGWVMTIVAWVMNEVNRVSTTVD
ncbi:hypothetical protein [Flavobacterium sp. XGLA_31]